MLPKEEQKQTKSLKSISLYLHLTIYFLSPIILAPEVMFSNEQLMMPVSGWKQ